MWDELNDWLLTPQAQKLGFHSKAQFATQAVKELLEQYKRGMDDKYIKILKKLNSIESKLDETLGKNPQKKKLNIIRDLIELSNEINFHPEFIYLTLYLKWYSLASFHIHKK